jgi:hypothetical protein
MDIYVCMLDVRPGIRRHTPRLLWPRFFLAISSNIGFKFLFICSTPLIFFRIQFATTKVYDYHPQMSIPDSESPEQSLGDCSICMDAIVVDSPSHLGDKGHSGDRSSSGGSLFSVVQRGMAGASATRKDYSLAPCHHLFVSEGLLRWGII